MAKDRDGWEMEYVFRTPLTTKMIANRDGEMVYVDANMPAPVAVHLLHLEQRAALAQRYADRLRFRAEIAKTPWSPSYLTETELGWLDEYDATFRS